MGGGTSDNGDTDGGRNVGFDDWEDVSFEQLNGRWEVVDCMMIVGPDSELNTDLSVKQFQFTAQDNQLSISTLDGRSSPAFMSDFHGNDAKYGTLNASGIVMLAGGTY